MKKNIIKVKRFQKLLICLVVMLLMVLSFIVGKITNANADEINYEYQSSNIEYDSTNNNLTATNVKDAIDELYSKVGQCPKGYNCLKDEDIIESDSSNIVKAYTYDENSCITGNEENCKKTICYLSKNTNACPTGTIVDYRVDNLNTEDSVVRFHVLHDNGTTITMQSQKNTVYNTAWYSVGNNHKEGPQTIMAALKTATNGWSNVKDIALEDGMTQFNDGTSANNNCTDRLCSSDDSGGYSYSKLVNNESIGNVVKARMITITETAALGCTTAKRSCPIYLYNYLEDSVSYCRVSGKCTNDTHTENGASSNYGYWTFSAPLTSFHNNAWSVNHQGSVDNYYYSYTSCTGHGARAVIVVNK